MAATGSHVGAYAVLEPIGAGGMGEVYRAHDTRLDRDVALKFLPVEVAGDADRLARFKREARALASLNHTNIAQIYGLEESDGTCCIAMELVKGETLQARLAHGPLLASEALRVARDIADGLEAAHEKGIVHRDLKPANVMVQPDDHVKVLDFGLAKALDTSAASAATDNSPTRTALTNPNFIVGTAAYMSPEQARGVSTDHRTDVFSLGCVLYEMLTGARAFNGDTSRDVIVSVVAREPDLSRLPSDLHPDVRVLIRRCLEKSVRHRWQAIGDVRIEIERILAAHPTGLKTGDDSAKAPEWWRTAAIVATIVAITAVATLVTWRMRATRSEVTRPVRRFSIPLEMVRPVVSPDGQHIAYRSQDRLWIRDLSSDVSREIPGGEARGGYYNDTGYYLTWSPDNQSLAFLAENEIRRASVVGSGSATMTICTLPPSSTPNKRVGGMAWSHDGGSIVFSRYGAGIYEVPARGGVPIRLSDDQHADDLVIVDTPRGRALLYAVLGPRGHDLMVRTPAGESRKVTELESSWPELVYVPTGHILFRKLPVENPSLWALPFSVTTLRALGEPFMVERSGLGASLAEDGTLVYLDNISRGQQVLAWRGRDGKILGKASEGHAVIRAARLSPDGGRAIATTVEPTQTGLWIYDVQRFARTRLMTEDRSTGQFILFGFWAKRNNDVYYAIGNPLDQESNIFTRAVDGPDKPRQLPFSKGFMVAQDATADGRYVVVTRSVAGANANQIYYWHNDGQAKSQAVDFSSNAEQEQAMVLSPNGRFIAYTSTVGDRLEVYVRPFPEGAGRWQISTRGGVGPRWHTDGSALFFVENNSLMRVGVSTTGSFSAAATATALFESPLLRGDPGPFARYDVSPDGRRFLTVEYEREIAQPLVRVAENWLSDFRARQSK